MRRHHRRPRRPPVLALAIPLALCACADRNRIQAPLRPEPIPTPRNAVAVLGEKELAQASDAGASLADALRRNVPSLRVDRGGQPGSCPRIQLRGIKSIMLSSEPEVYVNGVRHGDTCILDILPPDHVQAVQVYGAGQSPPSVGLRSSPGGLILVYLKRE